MDDLESTRFLQVHLCVRASALPIMLPNESGNKLDKMLP